MCYYYSFFTSLHDNFTSAPGIELRNLCFVPMCHIFAASHFCCSTCQCYTFTKILTKTCLLSTCYIFSAPRDNVLTVPKNKGSLCYRCATFLLFHTTVLSLHQENELRSLYRCAAFFSGSHDNVSPASRLGQYGVRVPDDDVNLAELKLKLNAPESLRLAPRLNHLELFIHH